MAKQESKSAPPRGLLWLGAVGAVAAIAYAFWSSTTPVAPVTSPPPQVSVAPPVADEPPPDATAGQLVITGNARMDVGAYTAAIKYYSRALELDPSLVDVWVDRGACLHAIGDGPGARADFNRGLALDPVHVIAHFNMGVTYLTDAVPDSARSWWNRMLLLSPTGLHAERARALLAHIDSLESLPAP